MDSPRFVNNDTGRHLVAERTPRGRQANDSTLDTSIKKHSDPAQSAPAPIFRFANADLQARSRRVDRSLRLSPPGFIHEDPAAQPTRRTPADKENAQRRYSFPDTPHDREGGEPGRNDPGFLTNAWNRGKRLVHRVSKFLGGHVDETEQPVPQQARKGITKITLWVLGVVLLSYIGHQFRPVLQDTVAELKSFDLEQYVALRVLRIAEQVESFVEDKIAEVEPLDLEHPEIQNYRQYPGWIHAHDPYHALKVARPLIPGWGPPPMPLVRKAFKEVANKWHVDRWKDNFGKNGTVDAALAQKQARYAYSVLDKAKDKFEHFWTDPVCITVKAGPLDKDIASTMSDLGLPFVDPTCTPCAWRDAAMKFGKVFLQGPKAVRDPSRNYCPCSLLRKLQDLRFNLLHLPPAGLHRYYPHRIRRLNTPWMSRKSSLSPPPPPREGLEEGSSWEPMVKMLEKVSILTNGRDGLIGQQYLRDRGYTRAAIVSTELARLMRKGWIHARDVEYVSTCEREPNAPEILWEL